MPGEWHEYKLDVPYVTDVDSVPEQLITKLREGRCILFIGAGASLGAKDTNGKNLPSWGRMVNELLNELDAENPQEQNISLELQHLLEMGELLALSEWIDANISRNVFSLYLQRRLSTASNSQVHEILSQKNFAGVITTNYDNLVEDYWQRAGWNTTVITPHMSVSEISVAKQILQDPNRSRTLVIKPHGTWERPDSLVFGPRTYRQIIYNNEPFRQFMASIFTSYTVLFVGLSFKDPNLQSLLQWIYTSTQGTIPTHYATMENRGSVFKKYMWANFNIRLITYPVPPLDHSACQIILNSL